MPTSRPDIPETLRAPLDALEPYGGAALGRLLAREATSLACDVRDDLARSGSALVAIPGPGVAAAPDERGEHRRREVLTYAALELLGDLLFACGEYVAVTPTPAPAGTTAAWMITRVAT